MINLIEEHKSVSDEIVNLNLMFRRSAFGMLITLSAERILMLYMLIQWNSNNIFVNIFFLTSFFQLIALGLGITYLFSLQIKSAHQSHNLIYSNLSRRKMKMEFKLKVVLFIINRNNLDF